MSSRSRSIPRSLPPGDREQAAKMRQNAVDAVMNDAWRDSAGQRDGKTQETTTSRAVSFGYNKVRRRTWIDLCKGDFIRRQNSVHDVCLTTTRKSIKHDPV